jgi:hypothetical protein
MCAQVDRVCVCVCVCAGGSGDMHNVPTEGGAPWQTAAECDMVECSAVYKTLEPRPPARTLGYLGPAAHNMCNAPPPVPLPKPILTSLCSCSGSSFSANLCM